MSCVCILTPVVIAAWPAFSAAVMAAATSLGYTLVEQKKAEADRTSAPEVNRVDLEVPRSEVVLDTLQRDKSISVTRDGVTVTFARDPRGKASLCVSGEGHTEAELKALGEELSQRLVQKYV